MYDDKLWYHAACQYKELLPGHYYYLHNVELTWVEAAQFCSAQGSHLLILNSQEEANAIVRFVEDGKNTAYWIGAHDMYKEGEFITIHGTYIAENN